MCGDIVPDAFGGGGGEGHDGDVGEQFAELEELAVFGSEVVAPLGDAVGFVDGEGFDVPGFEIFAPIFEHEAFGGDVEEAVLAVVKASDSARYSSLERLELRKVAATPAASSWSTWSFMRAIRGETTRVRPGARGRGAGSRGICRRRWGGWRRRPGRRR